MFLIKSIHGYHPLRSVSQSEIKREKEKVRGRERESGDREREREGGREGERGEREMWNMVALFSFLTEMTGALAPFSYLVYYKLLVMSAIFFLFGIDSVLNINNIRVCSLKNLAGDKRSSLLCHSINGTAKFKNVNNCLKANIYSYLETSGAQSSNI